MTLKENYKIRLNDFSPLKGQIRYGVRNHEELDFDGNIPSARVNLRLWGLSLYNTVLLTIPVVLSVYGIVKGLENLIQN